MFSGYIPTAQILALFGLTTYQSTAKEKMKVQVLNHVGDDFPVMGTSIFECQYNPEMIDYPELRANYVSMNAVGLIRPTLHYTGGAYQPISVKLVVEDSYSGPPHAQKLPDGTIQCTYFSNLIDVINWFYSLASPIVEWGKPPITRLLFGPYMKTGVVQNVSATGVSFYPDATPRIVEINFTLQPDVILVTADQSVFEVD